LVEKKVKRGPFRGILAEKEGGSFSGFGDGLDDGKKKKANSRSEFVEVGSGEGLSGNSSGGKGLGGIYDFCVGDRRFWRGRNETAKGYRRSLSLEPKERGTRFREGHDGKWKTILLLWARKEEKTRDEIEEGNGLGKRGIEKEEASPL